MNGAPSFQIEFWPGPRRLHVISAAVLLQELDPLEGQHVGVHVDDGHLLSPALATLRHRDGRLASHQATGRECVARLTRRTMLGAAAASLVARSAPAQTWPSGPIRIVVPFPPGGSTDALARLVQTGLQQRLGANIIIENKPGASGAAGTAVFAKSPPDGNTWLIVFDTHSVNPYLMNLQYDTEKDLDPVMLVATAPYLLAVNTKHDFKIARRRACGRQGKAGRLVLRVGRLRLDRAPVHGAAAEEDRREAHPRALSRRRSCDERCARRACRFHHRQRRAGHAAARQRQAAPDRADRREARAGAARTCRP